MSVTGIPPVKAASVSRLLDLTAARTERMCDGFIFEFGLLREAIHLTLVLVSEGFDLIIFAMVTR